MITDCKHYCDGRQIPCPPMCPVQAWPVQAFRLTWFRGRWKLRRRFSDHPDYRPEWKP